MNCNEFGLCGGCTYLDIPYERELVLKQNAMAELLKDFLPYPEKPKIIPAPNPVGYRNKMEFSFGDTGTPALALGIRRRRRQYEVSVPEHCVLIPEEFKKILLYTLDFFRDTSETFYHKKRRTGSLRYLILRRGEFTGEVLINLVTTSSLQTDLSAWTQGLKTTPGVVGILHTISDSRSDAVVPEQCNTLWGQQFFHEKLCGLTFEISPFAFFQTNSAGAEKLFLAVKDAVHQTGKLYDLYCGTGTIAQILSPCAEEVIGIELVEEAILSARKNAAANGIENARFFAADMADAGLSHADCVIVDPPRPGLHPKAMEKLLAVGAEKIVYISCKPESLARDLGVLTGYGYRVGDLWLHDMFPRTPHVEVVCVLKKT